MASIPLPPFSKEAVQSVLDTATKLLPSEASREDFHHNIQLLLQSGISKMDLVTREEFDAQKAVLLKLQARMTELEDRVKQLESKAGF